MKIVVALDSFKGSMTAERACALAAEEICLQIPSAVVLQRPMADGGEGTARAMMNALGGRWIERTVMGPLPDMEVEAGFAWFEEGKTALVEMAAASGLERLGSHQRNPLKTTTYGTGQLMKASLEYQPDTILLAVGGSATVDGGAGAAAALGWGFLDKYASPIPLGGVGLNDLATLLAPADLNLPPVQVLCDVDNPLCGEHGAARVYGPQKGASPEMVDQLEDGLFRLGRVVSEQIGKDILNLRGGGAAGGLAAGAVAFMNATLVSGIDTIIAHYNLHKELADADWVITGEGCFDHQSLRGKVISGIVKAADRTPAKVAVLAGQVRMSPQDYEKIGVSAACACKKDGMDIEYAISHSESLLRETARELVIQKICP
ncbi:MAG: glycerate kinase [Planctomycetota bacterium]